MTADELAKELAKGSLRSAYLFAGEEVLLRDDALAALETAVLDGGDATFNVDRFDAGACTASQLRDAVGALPMMASRRFVLFAGADSKRAGVKAVVDALPDIVAEIADRDDVVLAVTAAKPDKRSRWVKAFGAKGGGGHAAIVSCDAPTKARELTAFVSAEAARQGLEMAEGAAQLMAERVGPQLMLLRQEVAKAGLIAGPGAAVTREHVTVATAQVAEEKIWDLTDAIGEGRSGDALVLLGRLSDAPAPVLLASLASHFRRLARVHAGDRAAGPPFVVRKLENQARRLTRPRVLAGLRAIHETDTAIKGASSLPPELAIERLVLNLSV